VQSAAYDPFSRGPIAFHVRTVRLRDAARDLVFPVEIWSPDHPGPHPLVIYSHHSGGSRRAATFLCTHLASHGYEVAAMDHFEVVARGALPADRDALIEAVIAGRVPDVRFLIGHFARAQVGLVGHSLGGWTVLATPEVDDRVRSVVAMGAGGSNEPRPGILPVTLTFNWLREVPALYLAAENDVPIPLEGALEIYERAPEPKRMFILRRADHQHFLDDVEGAHEAVRRANFPAEAAWIPAAMLPISELSSGEQAHTFVRGLTLAHFDATLRRLESAERFLDADVQAALAARGVDAMPPSPSRSNR
jgi:dienelactone hydrolase